MLYDKTILIKNIKFFDLDTLYSIKDQALSCFEELTGEEILEQLDRFRDEIGSQYQAPVATKEGTLENQHGVILAAKINNRYISKIYKTKKISNVHLIFENILNNFKIKE